jgi:polar amino acid transport system substrate-binding protein
LFAACVPPEPDPFPRRHEPDTYMAVVQDAGTLRIGIPEDSAPIGYVDETGAPQGLAVELGRFVARALHVRPDFRAYPSERLLGLVAIGGLDLGFPVTPLTEELVRNHRVTDPYLVAHQRLLVPAASAWDGVDDLSGVRTCSYTEPRTGVELVELNPDVIVEPAPDPMECGARFRRGRVDAVTAPDFYLLSIVRGLGRGAPSARDARLTGDDLNTAGYAAAVIPVSGFAEFVRLVFEDAESDGRWRRAFEKTVGPPPPSPPALTLEEAAALWPIPR